MIFERVQSERHAHNHPCTAAKLLAHSFSYDATAHSWLKTGRVFRGYSQQVFSIRLLQLRSLLDEISGECDEVASFLAVRTDFFLAVLKHQWQS